MEQQLIEHYLPGVQTPIMLPSDYALVSAVGDKIVYINAVGEQVEHYTYLDHEGTYVIVDEFRKQFPHDSILVLVYDSEQNMYLQLRSKAMRWEPNKIDLASVAAQRRGVLVGDHYEAVDLHELALAKVAEETGLAPSRMDAVHLTLIGEHQNTTTNEFQTIFAYRVDVDVAELNSVLAEVDDIYKAQSWEKRPFTLVMEQYFGHGVEEYAGGSSLRPLNFISNPAIRTSLEKLITSVH